MDQGRIKLEVTNSPFQIKPDIRIAGHNLMVRADDERGKPMAGVTVTLYADQQVNVISSIDIDQKNNSNF
jgi:hypothetical protein